MGKKLKISTYLDRLLDGRASDTFDLGVVPLGVIAVVNTFSCFDVNNGDNKDAVIFLQFGDESAMTDLSVIGKIYKEPKKIEVVGDGRKFFRIKRVNNSESPRQIFVWFEATLDVVDVRSGSGQGTTSTGTTPL